MDQINQRAHFITIERPLEPQPPKEAKPHWCYIGTLIFYNDKDNKVWSQEIKEATILNEKGNSVFKCEVLYMNEFGWQLKSTISHDDAKFVLPFIISKIDGKYQQD